MPEIIGTLSGYGSLSGNVSSGSAISGSLSRDMHYNYYSGPFSVVPSSEEQTIHTANFVVGRDIIVAPIPSNYGLVTWNGSVLTIS